MADENIHTGFLGSEGILILSPREALEQCTIGAVMLDVREEYVNEFKRFGVAAVFQIPLSRLGDEYARLPLDRLIIIADSSGIRSTEAIMLLKERGFRQLANLAGGLVEWERDGMPLATDTSEKLSGSCACQLRARNTGDAKQT